MYWCFRSPPAPGLLTGNALRVGHAAAENRTGHLLRQAGTPTILKCTLSHGSVDPAVCLRPARRLQSTFFALDGDNTQQFSHGAIMPLQSSSEYDRCTFPYFLHRSSAMREAVCSGPVVSRPLYSERRPPSSLRASGLCRARFYLPLGGGKYEACQKRS